MKPIYLLPPLPATRQAIAAFHLRERRLYAVIACLLCLVLVAVCVALCLSSSTLLVRAIWAGLAHACGGAAGIYAARATILHLTVRRTEGGAR